MPSIIVHGGAGGWADVDEEPVLASVRAAALAGWEILRSGGTSLDAVEAASRLLEDDPQFDSGYGSFLNELGEVEMDALIADGATMRFGAVAAVRRVRHAISLARLVMTQTDNCFFAGDGADQLAARLGMPLIANVELITDKELATFRARTGVHAERVGLGTGTVGAVALDAAGHIASATSTGGTPDKKKGRVGDSPIFGAGGYADDQYGAASATGRGENIMRFLLCRQVIDEIRGGRAAREAAQAALRYLSSRIPDPEAGVIVVDSRGNLGAAHTTAAMPVAWVNADGSVGTAMRSG
jgi:beta-aspartyl-peptidase (threonine type)